MNKPEDSPENPLVTVETLKRMLHYNPETGVWVWLVAPSFRVRAGTRAGSDLGRKPGGKKMVQIGIMGRSYLASRLAWLYMTGVWPIGVVDHENGNHADQRWENLRDVPQSMNVENQRKPHKRNKSSGLLGVSWFKRDSVWLAKLGVTRADGKHITMYLGRFNNKFAAHRAYLKAKRAHHAGCLI